MTALPSGSPPQSGASCSGALRRILVIKTGALGDFIQAFGPFQAIRNAHPNASLVLLTGKAFVTLGQESGFFDEVLTDPRPKALHLGQWLRFLRTLRPYRFQRVYDLQRKNRQYWLWQGLKYGLPKDQKLEWSGVFKGCDFYQPDRKTDHRHGMDKIAEQLAIAGLPGVPPADLSGLQKDLSAFAPLPADFALLVPGAAPTRPKKKWPAADYGQLAQKLLDHNITPIVIGTETERDDIQALRNICPAALDFSGRTDFGHLVSLATQARFAIGNDTGPMHLFAAAGCPLLVLYSADSDPQMTLPRNSHPGRPVHFLQCPDLRDLSLDQVWEQVRTMFLSL